MFLPLTWISSSLFGVLRELLQIKTILSYKNQLILRRAWLLLTFTDFQLHLFLTIFENKETKINIWLVKSCILR